MPRLGVTHYRQQHSFGPHQQTRCSRHSVPLQQAHPIPRSSVICHAVTHAASHRGLTTEVRGSVGFVVGKVATGQVSLQKRRSPTRGPKSSVVCGQWVLVGKPEGKRPLGRPRRRWVDNIRMDLWGEGCIGSWWGNRRERDYCGDLGVDGWIILGWICGERGV